MEFSTAYECSVHLALVRELLGRLSHFLPSKILTCVDAMLIQNRKKEVLTFLKQREREKNKRECLLPHSRTRTPISADGWLCDHLGSAASKRLMCPSHILEAMPNNSQILCWMGCSVNMRQVTMERGTQLDFNIIT